jgi:ribose 5-phosphate isomerase B
MSSESPNRIVIAADHGGFQLKQELAAELNALGFEVEDLGTHSPDSVDYPDFASELSRRVAGGDYRWGVLCCGTGVGMSMAANKVPGIRAAVVSDSFSARMSRAHNDANVLCLGERVVGPGLAKEILHAWLDTPFEGGRHARRVNKIRDLEPG